MQIPFGAITILIFLSIMSLIVGFCVILAATTQDLQYALLQLIEMLGKNENNVRKKAKLKQDLLEIYRIHFKMKE